MNDPNGLIYWKGAYHLFYQYNPNEPSHRAIHWGHAVSHDLVHWQHLPLALAPTPGGPDADGIWSGCAVDDHGIPTLVYTGTSPQNVCLATGSDDLLHWEKHPGNPVIPGPPFELAEAAHEQFRDPYVWQEDGGWQMVIGSKIAGQGGAILRFHSNDLVHWEYQGILMAGDAARREPFWTGAMWECPNYFEVGGKKALVFSVQSERNELLYPVYYVGDECGLTFIPMQGNILVHGGSFYAPLVMRAENGRLLMWGWLQEKRSPDEFIRAGWAGVMSLPLEISLTPEEKLCIEPVAELQSLRRKHQHFENLALTPDFPGLPEGIQGDSLEIEAVFEPGPDAEFGLKLLASLDGQEQTRVVYAAGLGRLSVDCSASSLNSKTDRTVHDAPLSLETDRFVRLHIYLDHSVLEVFANRQTCLVCRAYPTSPDSIGVDLFALRGETSLISLDIWRIDSI